MVLLLAISISLVGQENPKDKGLEAVTMGAIQGQLEFLASDWTLGRETGTDGAYMAADYIASMFKVWGLEPGGDMEQRRMTRGFRRGGPPPEPPKRTFYQNFQLVESWAGDDQELSIITKKGSGTRAVDFNYQTDFSISGGETGISGEVPVVFAGYGLKDDAKGYNDFKALGDLNGKIVVVLSGFPGQRYPDSKAYAQFKPAESGDDRNTDMMRFFRGRSRYPWAAEMGVVAVIEYSPNSNPTVQWVTNQRQATEIAGPGPAERKSMRLMEDKLGNNPFNVTATQRVVNELVSGLGYTFEDLEKQIAESGKPASRELTGKFIRFKTSVNSRILTARNVIGVLPGKDTTNIIVVGGHYDHMGERDGWIYNGADDNASGTVGVMTIARAMAATGQKPEKTIVFCAWTAEEKGLIGSSYFVQNHYDWNLLCNLNYDMISRNSPGEDQDKKIRMTYSSGMPLLEELTTKHNADYNLGMDVSYSPSETPRGGSDHAPFAEAGVPIFYFMAGMPPEYHQPQDHVSLVVWDKMLNIIKLGYLNIYELSNMKWD